MESKQVVRVVAAVTLVLEMVAAAVEVVGEREVAVGDVVVRQEGGTVLLLPVVEEAAEEAGAAQERRLLHHLQMILTTISTLHLRLPLFRHPAVAPVTPPLHRI